jgi:phosphoenolpyruvate carboxylase
MCNVGHVQGGGVETLRAIPWIFAWTQIRMVLPAWLGIDTALRRLFDDVRLLHSSHACLQTACTFWMQPLCRLPWIPG